MKILKYFFLRYPIHYVSNEKICEVPKKNTDSQVRFRTKPTVVWLMELGLGYVRKSLRRFLLLYIYGRPKTN